MENNKRIISGDPATAPEIKFEITNNIFVVVCIFKGGLYIHVRKYENRYPTREGVCLNSEEWNFVSELLCRDGEKKTSAPFGSVLVKKNKNKTATLTSMTRGTTVYLTDIAVANIKTRYVNFTKSIQYLIFNTLTYLCYVPFLNKLPHKLILFFSEPKKFNTL